MVNLIGLSLEEIAQHIESMGTYSAHSLYVSNTIYKKRITEFPEFIKIPKSLRDKLSAAYEVGIYPPEKSEISDDMTVKYLFKTKDGKAFESVYIPDKKRNTVCVSTQSGCKMACSFCVTGRYGFKGNLTAGEIVNQIISIPGAEKVSHVVFMGMGEPMDNLENVIKACEIIISEWGLALSPRNVTVSTVGITPAIEEFLNRSECNLTLSLFSPFHEQRFESIPVEKFYPVIDIIGILKAFPLRKKRRISLAYMMIKGVNDTDDHLIRLILLLKGSSIRVNLLPYHTTESDVNVPSTDKRMMLFKHELVMSGVSASIRKSRGEDISAACGLLASNLVKH